jgi:glycosyltransferase involved in cell wall biosynthesis
MRALVITCMYPSAQNPASGSFVRDQVAALRRMADLEVELFVFQPGRMSAYVRAAHDVRRRYRGVRFDVIHAHFGLTIWPALGLSGIPHAVTLHGTDLVNPRSRLITVAGLPFMDLVAPVSAGLGRLLPRKAVRGEIAVLPCGVDTGRFKRIDRVQARRALGLDEVGPYLLFPANPARPEKRYDRARAVAGDVRLLILKDVDPCEVPLWINAANAVLVPSERESYGLAVLEALACDVPVIAAPVGNAPEVLDGIDGTYCGRFDVSTWRAAVEPLLAHADPRVEGRSAAELHSADRMADRVKAAWATLR